MKQRLILMLIAASLTACAATPEETLIKNVDELYRDAYKSIQYGNYFNAEDNLQRIMSRYPFTDFAVQAHLDMLFVLMQMGETERLAEEADRFIRENPRHPRIDYVYYMKGIGYYHDAPNPLERLFNLDKAHREITNAQTAFRNFSQLVSRYPDSGYSADARLRMIELRNRMARHEMYVADYYLRVDAWVSALQRAEYVLENLQGTPAEIDALIVMERCYEELGLEDLAAIPRRILAANPGREPIIIERD